VISAGGYLVWSERQPDGVQKNSRLCEGSHHLRERLGTLENTQTTENKKNVWTPHSG